MATRAQPPLPGFCGELIAPGDSSYDDARQIWNGAIDRRPGLIARCASAADVAAAVRFARERELPVAVRGGGHGVAGHAVCDDGLVVDLSPMKSIAVDPQARTARAEAGVLWGELDGAAQAHGLATVGGIVTHTGISGLTLGGGIGWLMRKHGATVDNLRSAEVVTADGETLTASEDERPELLWGLRGGGGNFGVVTSFEYRLHAVGPTVLAGPIYHGLDDAPQALRFYRDFIADSPDELTTIVRLGRAPALPFLPEHVHGRPVVTIACCWAGDPQSGESALRPLRSFGNPLADALAPRAYSELQRMFDPSVPHGWHYYWKSWELPPLADAAIDALVEQAGRLTSPRSYIIVFQLGGAVGRVPADATAFGQRHAGHDVNINAVWLADDPDPDRHVQWTREAYAALEPFSSGRTYVNFIGDEGRDRVRAAYGEEKYARLVELKRTYDPDNVFRLNQNIDPA
ncbi:MAG TPA: FAD-binding oxidoreductase [Thermoleophilaceae bacterium]